MTFKVLSLFPEAISPYLSSSILGRAEKNGLIRIEYYNIRDYSLDKHRRVDEHALRRRIRNGYGSAAGY